jgi:MFS family permease
VQSAGPGLGLTAAIGGLSIGLLAAFIARQARAANPILPLRLFASRRLSAVNGVQALMTSAFLGFFFMASLDFERVLRYGPLEIGLAFLPVAVVMGVFSIGLSARLTSRFGPLRMLLVGQVVVAAALALLGFGPGNPVYALHLMVPLALLGIGGGLAFPALTMLAMSEVEPTDAGLASGLLNTTGQVGGALGVAALATLAGARTLSLVHGSGASAPALSAGYHLAWLVAAGAALVSLALATTVLRGRGATVEVVPADLKSAA